MYLPVSRKLSVLSVSLCKKKKPHTHKKTPHTQNKKTKKKQCIITLEFYPNKIADSNNFNARSTFRQWLP